MTFAPRVAAAVLAVLIVGCGAPTEVTAPPSGSPAPSASEPDGTFIPPPMNPGEALLPGIDAPVGEPIPAPDPAPAPGAEDAPTSAGLILDAVARGELSAEDAAVYRVLAAFGDDRLPEPFRGEGPNEDHLATRAAAGLWDQLTVAQRETIAPYFIPPAYEGSWLEEGSTADVFTLASSNSRRVAALDPKDCASEQLRSSTWANTATSDGAVRVWWRTGVETEPQYAAYVGSLVTEIETKVWPAFAALLGRTPHRDDAVGCFNGEDGALDIYLYDRPLDVGGDALTIAYPGRCTDTPAFILFSSASDVAQWKVAHEIFHAFQYAYRYAGPCDEFSFMDEATAMWAAEHVYQSDQFEWAPSNFLTQPKFYARFFEGNGDEIFADGIFYDPYGGWPFFASLSNRQGDAIVASLYEATEAATSGYEAMDAVTPGGLQGYWPQFVRDLWDDFPEQNVWPEWDPGTYATAREGANGWTRLAKGPGGIWTTETGHPNAWALGAWSKALCGALIDDLPGWFLRAREQDVGSWECIPGKGEPFPPQPPRVELERPIKVPGLGRNEQRYYIREGAWPRYLRFESPDLGSESDALSIQAYYATRGGGWTGPIDLAGRSHWELCLDDPSEDAMYVVLLYGNSTLPVLGASDAATIEGSYQLIADEICPVTVSGTLTNSNVVAIRAPDGQTDSVHTTTMDMTLEPLEHEPTRFDAVGGSWRMEYTMDSWEDNTYNAGADGCILTETAAGSFAGAWDELSTAEFSYDPVSLWGSLGFSITPTGDYTTTANCPGIFGPTTATVDASQYLVAIGVYSVQGRREGDRIVFEFDEERVSGDSSQFTTTLTGTLVTTAGD